MADTGRNITPDKLSAAERAAIAEPRDRHLLATLKATQPEWCIGVGAYARQCFERVLGRKAGKPVENDGGPQIGQILHPSPASPAANRGWAEAAYKQLLALNVWSVRRRSAYGSWRLSIYPELGIIRRLNLNGQSMTLTRSPSNVDATIV